MTTLSKLKILFLCTGNSCRSQMAEAWTRHLKYDCIEPYSAGIEKHGLNTKMLQVMKEINIDVSMLTSKTLSEVNEPFDFVITMCSNADRNCPVFWGNTVVKHIGFNDPPELARQFTQEEDKLNCYRMIRDEIRQMIELLPGILYR